MGEELLANLHAKLITRMESMSWMLHIHIKTLNECERSLIANKKNSKLKYKNAYMQLLLCVPKHMPASLITHSFKICYNCWYYQLNIVITDCVHF